VQVQFAGDLTELFFVQKGNVKWFLADRAPGRQAELNSGRIVLDQVSSFAFSTIVRFICAREWETGIDLGQYNNSQVTDLYATASEFGHGWLQDACLHSIRHKVTVGNFVKDFNPVFFGVHATEKFKHQFRDAFVKCLEFNGLDDASKSELMIAIMQGGMAAAEIARAMHDEIRKLSKSPSTVENLNSASRRLQEIVHGDEVQTPQGWDLQDAWDQGHESSDRSEVPSESAIAKDGWSGHACDLSWGTSNAEGAYGATTVGEPGDPVDTTVNDSGWFATATGPPLPNDQLDWGQNDRQLAQVTTVDPIGGHGEPMHPRRRMPAASGAAMSFRPPPPPAGPPPAADTNRASTRFPNPPLHRPFPPPGPQVAEYHIPPIGMPNHVPGLGFPHFQHVGNGLMHPTAPGLYGLAGRTMMAIRGSDHHCTVAFQAGDTITNVVSYLELQLDTMTNFL
jgi:hypothetical protein